MREASRGFEMKPSSQRTAGMAVFLRMYREKKIFPRSVGRMSDRMNYEVVKNGVKSILRLDM